jgi:UDP-N-acetylmuramoyl-tripeptide--D-alanyl-D-alanine ligase
VTGTGGATVVRVEDTTRALQELARWLRHHLDPTVVAVTGSLGKTTTKELTAALLSTRYDVHATPGNLNNHWGLPLSLLGLEPHHELMVAEMAMSRAGEIRALARLAAPEVGVITNVAPAHMENFADLEAVAEAKGELAEELPASGTLIVSADDPRTSKMPQTVATHVSRVVRFGRHRDADVRAAGVAASASGWSFTLRVGAESRDITLNLPGIAGISSFLAAAAVAWALDVPLDAIAAQAPTLKPIANRGAVRLVDGLTLLDESYNASPVAVKAALDTLAGLPVEGRRVAVLGDMLEMGEWTDRVHREVGRRATEIGVDLLLAVGACADLIAEGAILAGMDEAAVHEFSTAEDAAAWLPERLRAGDALLVKGSRGVHLEHVVNAVTTASVIPNGAVDR